MTDRLAIDRSIRSTLGGALSDLLAALHPIDCQTCGQRFTDTDELSLAVDASGPATFAALHHRACRPSDWRNVAGGRVGSRQLTWRGATFVWPGLDLTTILVNPPARAPSCARRACGPAAGGSPAW